MIVGKKKKKKAHKFGFIPKKYRIEVDARESLTAKKGLFSYYEHFYVQGNTIYTTTRSSRFRRN